MKKETQNSSNEHFSKIELIGKNYMLPVSFLISAALVAGAFVYSAGIKEINVSQKVNAQAELEKIGNIAGNVSLEEKILPLKGFVLPVHWNGLGKQMIESGVIEQKKFEDIYRQRGGLNEESKNLLYGDGDENLKITRENAGFLLNLFWALGLGNKNNILENGPMADSRYGGTGNFASTGGWTLAKGGAMSHYSRHHFIILTPEQQKLVEETSKNIYRPCCDNSTYFPDCNHGMAMLGLLELMASQGVSENEMYKIALQVNAYWFPDTYLTIAQYLIQNGMDWNMVNPKELLGANYSSGSGYSQILSQITEPIQRGGGSCGV